MAHPTVDLPKTHHPAGLILADVVVCHLATVDSSLDASRLEVRGDGWSVDAERAGEIGECSSCLVLVDEFVDFGIGQATLDRSSGWV